MTVRAKKIRGAVAAFAATALAVSLVPAGALAYASQQPAVQPVSDEANPVGALGGYFDPVDEAQDVLLDAQWVAEPGEVTDVATFWIWLKAKIESLGLSKVSLRIDERSLEWEAPVAGTAEEPAGRDGGFSVTLCVYRNWFDALAARRVVISGVLKAEPYELGPTEPDVPEVPDVPDVPENPDPVPPSTDGDGDGSEEPDEPEKPGTDDKEDPPTPPTGPEPGPGPYVPADVEEAVQLMEERIKAQQNADKDAWTMPESTTADDTTFATKESAKKAVRSYVEELLKAKDIVPAGYECRVGEPEVVLPTENAAGSYACPVFISKEDPAETEQEEAVIEARGLALHPLRTTQAATNVKASPGSIEDLPISNPLPDLVIEGLIPKLKPKTVKPVEVPGGTINGIANHPLAGGQASGSITEIAGSSSSDSEEGSEREVKRPQQLSDDKRKTPDVKTTVQTGSSIASTRDTMMGSPALLGSIGAIAAVVAAVCLLLVRRRQK